jgi:hypothetical protein
VAASAQPTDGGDGGGWSRQPVNGAPGFGAVVC